MVTMRSFYARHMSASEVSIHTWGILVNSEFRNLSINAELDEKKLKKFILKHSYVE